MSLLGNPSFVKLLIEEDFGRTMRIPPAFMGENEDELADDWVLETATLNRKFSAQVQQYGGLHYYLCGPGWREFARCVNLSAGDILVFRCVVKSCDSSQHSVFEVEVYDGSGLAKTKILHSPSSIPCRTQGRSSSNKPAQRLRKSKYKSHRRQSKRHKTNKDPSVKEEQLSESSGDEGDQQDSKSNESEEEETEEEEVVECTMTLLKHLWIRLVFPGDFVRKARLNEKGDLLLINPISGKKWQVELSRNSYRLAIGKGWTYFRRDNKLKVGGTYKFTLVQDDDRNKLLFHHIS